MNFLILGAKRCQTFFFLFGLFLFNWARRFFLLFKEETQYYLAQLFNFQCCQFQKSTSIGWGDGVKGCGNYVLEVYFGVTLRLSAEPMNPSTLEMNTSLSSSLFLLFLSFPFLLFSSFFFSSFSFPFLPFPSLHFFSLPFPFLSFIFLLFLFVYYLSSLRFDDGLFRFKCTVNSLL